MAGTKHYRLTSHVAWQVADGEVFVVDLARGEGLGLNRTASWLWLRIADGATPDATTFAEHYGIPASTADADVRTFLDDLTSAGLIESIA